MVDCRGLPDRCHRAGLHGGFSSGMARGARSTDRGNPLAKRAGMSASPNGHGCVVSAVALTKIYRRGREQVRALDNVTFEVGKGDFIAVVGPSGAGKSTLLNIVGCMDGPTSGTLRLLGSPVENVTERERTLLRREQIGFVFQHFGLLPTLTVAENVALPAFFARRRLDHRV